jgi:hypothetical protein
MGYIDSNGNYYEGDQVGNDLQVPTRPGTDYVWTNGAWVLNPAAAIASVQTEIQAALDTMAQSHGYDDIKSACAYAAPAAVVASTDPNFALCEKFRLEGNALQIWMSLTWAACYAYLATVNAGTNPMPTPAQAVAMIPAFTWPTVVATPST